MPTGKTLSTPPGEMSPARFLEVDAVLLRQTPNEIRQTPFAKRDAGHIDGDAELAGKDIVPGRALDLPWHTDAIAPNHSWICTRK